jgi:glyceraldehyde-3-phosphate dehydrogenase (NADP+)
VADNLSPSVFPSDESTPEKYRIVSPIVQRHYLCDGAIREWSGPQQDVLSPICEAIDGSFRPRLIGRYPLLTEREALESLDAAGHTTMGADCGRLCPSRNGYNMSRRFPTG